MKKFYVIFALISLISLTITAQPQLSWRFNNVEVINAGTQLQFDVEVKANVDGSYQRDLQIYFDYNTLAFGSNLVAGSNITYSPLTLLDAAQYVVVNTADNTTSKFAIITEATNEMTQPGSATYYKEVTTTYQGLLRFTIDIVSNTQTAGIAFDEALMNGGQYYQSTAPGTHDPVKYLDPCLYENNLSSLLLSSFYGVVSYNNGASTPLKLATLTLTGGDTYGPTVTGGVYYFTGMADGNYEISGTCTNISTGIAPFDATLVLRYYGGVISLTNLQKRAADVNMTNTAAGITPFDGTLILRKYGGVATPQWSAPTYVFDGPYPSSPALSGYPVSVSGGLGTTTLKALCAGDVNGNGTPTP